MGRRTRAGAESAADVLDRAIEHDRERTARNEGNDDDPRVFDLEYARHELDAHDRQDDSGRGVQREAQRTSGYVDELGEQPA